MPRCVSLMACCEPRANALRLSAVSIHAVEDLMNDVAGDDLLGRMVKEHLATGGKRLRAWLALEACAALGVPEPAAVGWAAACELAHNATLIHDDLQDGDTVRRGSPTVWVRHGDVQAINAGDLMLMLPFEAIDRVSSVAGNPWALGRLLGQRIGAVIRGQADEAALRTDLNLEPAAYEHAVRGKTSALFALPVEGACALAGHAELQASGFESLGVAFQMQDDVLDLYGDKGRERPGSDLAEGKISALTVAHDRRSPEDRGRMLALLSASRADSTETEIQWAIDAMQRSGALADVLQDIAVRLERGAEQVVDVLAPVYAEISGRILAPIAHLKSTI